FDRGWLLAWALLLLMHVPILAYVSWSQAQLAIDGGALLKRRLLSGALRLTTATIRSSGAGQLLGRVLESEAVETLALSGGHVVRASAIELIAAGVVLYVGASRWVTIPALAAWIVLTLACTLRYTNRRRTWTATRIDMTQDLVERMIGHRTRAAQER